MECVDGNQPVDGADVVLCEVPGTDAFGGLHFGVINRSARDHDNCDQQEDPEDRFAAAEREQV